MKIVHVGTDRLPCTSQCSRAIETYVYGISKKLARRGIDVHLITLGKSYKTIAKDGMTFHTFPTETLSGRLFLRLFVYQSPNRNMIFAFPAISKNLRGIEKEHRVIGIIHVYYFTTGVAPIVWRAIQVEVLSSYFTGIMNLNLQQLTKW
jgi:UDP:flavonoid glycosyltransferase YjiC (YdhE family)